MYVAFLGPGTIYGKDRRDNACIRRRGCRRMKNGGGGGVVVVLGASMGPGIPKGFRLFLLPTRLVSPP